MDVECPKRMEYGPCAGVHDDGRCEVAAHRCGFLDSAPRRWAGIDRVTEPPRLPLGAASATTVERLGRGQYIMSDFPIRDADRSAVEAGAAVLGAAVDAVLIGEPPSVRVQFPPAYRARLVGAAGATVWATVNCRDRNRVALEGELAGLADAGVAVVNCVTGDHNRSGSRPDAQPVFDLDSTELVALARSIGLAASVGESPEVPPVDRRPARFVEKAAAGAQLAFINLNSGPQAVKRFLSACKELGAARPAMVCVPFVVDDGSAAIMTGVGGHMMPPGFLEGVLGARDRREAGVVAAVGLARKYLRLPGVAGVCLSGGATRGAEQAYAEAMAEAALELRGHLSHA